MKKLVYIINLVYVDLLFLIEILALIFQELFKLEKQYSFKKFAELLLAQSGGIFEANSFTAPCEISRQTVSNYLAVLEATYVAHVIRPFNTHRPNEITSAPKVYGFDTGFIFCSIILSNKC